MTETVDRERGSGTVLIAGIVGAAVLLFGAGAALASAQLASGRARTAADLAALAAAGSTVRLEPVAGCAAAATVARANGARTTRCTDLGGGDFEVIVAVRPGLGRLGEATARARAGPDHAVGPTAWSAP